MLMFIYNYKVAWIMGGSRLDPVEACDIWPYLKDMWLPRVTHQVPQNQLKSVNKGQG